MKYFVKGCLPFLLAAVLFTGCGASSDASVESDQVFADAVPVELVELENEAVALSEMPAAITENLFPVASGILEKRSEKAVIDYSNTKDGYVMVQFTAPTEKRLKAQVKGPQTTYTYNLTPGKWETFVLSDGNGDYVISVYENVQDKQYATIVSVSCNVVLTDEFAPFLQPNQYVDYASAPNTVAKAAELTQGVDDSLKKVECIYDYVVQNTTYDKELAKTVQSGYLPVLDNVLEKKSGICFDYAALMTGMLRSQDVPCKLVVGYAGDAYHAWISVWTAETGWVDGAIYFDGNAWMRMDPTFASSGNQSESIMQYIGDGSNYSAKYFY